MNKRQLLILLTAIFTAQGLQGAGSPDATRKVTDFFAHSAHIRVLMEAEIKLSCPHSQTTKSILDLVTWFLRINRQETCCFTQRHTTALRDLRERALAYAKQQKEQDDASLEKALNELAETLKTIRQAAKKKRDRAGSISPAPEDETSH